MKKILLALLATITLLLPMPVMAQVNVFPQCGTGVDSAVCRATTGNTLFGAGSVWNRILNVITFVGGAAAVLVIVMGGLKYVLSNGDQGQITSAKNTILYAVIGLILAMLANAIVNFVLTNV